MTKALVFLSVLMLAMAPLSAAPNDKKDKDKDKDKDKKIEKDIGDKASASDDRRPSGREIAQEAGQVTYLKNETIEKKYGKGSQDTIRFTPVHIGGLKMRDFARGTVMGILDFDRKGDATGLPAGKYHVYIKQIKGDWASFYEKDGHVVKDAVGVKFFEEGHRCAKFKDGGDCVLFSHWEFCY